MGKIGIVGGGPAGVALAYGLSKSGHQVTLFEAAPELGGLARSFQFGDVKVERYYHFLCGEDKPYFELLDELGLRDKLVWKNTKMGFFHDGTCYPFSSAFDLLQFGAMSFPARVRYGVWTLACSLRSDWKPLDGVKARPWLIARVGLEAYQATWHALLDLKFHEHHGDVFAA